MTLCSIHFLDNYWDQVEFREIYIFVPLLSNDFSIATYNYKGKIYNQIIKFTK